MTTKITPAGDILPKGDPRRREIGDSYKITWWHEYRHKLMHFPRATDPDEIISAFDFLESLGVPTDEFELWFMDGPGVDFPRFDSGLGEGVIGWRGSTLMNHDSPLCKRYFRPRPKAYQARKNAHVE